MNYQTFYENAVEGIFQTTPDGQFISANPALAKLYGYETPAALLRAAAGWKQRRYLHEAEWLAFEAQIAAQGFVQGFEAQVRHRNGHPIWVTENVRAIRDEQGAIVAYEGTSLDITDRKQAETGLRHQEQRYVNAIKAGRVGVWDWDLTTDALYIEPILKQALGFADHEIPNVLSAWMELVHPSDRPLLKATINAHLQGQTTHFELEHRMLHKTGEVRWFLARGTALRNAAGEVVCLTGTDMDITEQKRAEEALRQSEERFRAIFEQAEVGMNIADLAGRFIKVNQALCNLVGYTEAELLQMTYLDLTYAPDQDNEIGLTEDLLADMIQNYSLEKRYVCKDGSLKWVNVHVSQVMESDGTIALCTAIIQDISARKASEAALRQSEATNRAIITAIPEILIRTHRDGTYIDIIESTTVKLMGAKEEMIGRTAFEVLPPPLAQQRMEAVHQALETKQLQVYHHQLEIAGQLYDEEIRVTPINADEALVMVQDITKHKRAEIALKLQADRDRALNQITQAIRNSLDLDTIFSTAVYEFAQLLNAGQAVLSRYIEARQVWRNIAFYSVDPTTPSTLGLEVSDHQNPLAAQLKRLEVVQLDDASLCQDDMNRKLAEAFPGSWLLVPIRLKGLWGSLGLVRRQTAAWKSAEVELVVAMTNQLAIAIQQSELYQQVQQLNTQLEQQVQERTLELRRALSFEALLKRITDQVRDSLDEHQILQTAVEALGVGLGVECCNAAIYAPDLKSHTVTHEFSRSQVFGLGQSIFFNDCPTIEIFDQLIAGHCTQFCFLVDTFAQPRANFYAVLACPLFDEHEVLGDLWLYKHKQEAFDDLEIRIVQQVANQCAIALRQSRLYQAAQAQVKELERLHHLKDDFLSTVSHELRTPMANIKMATQMLELGLLQKGLVTEPGDRLWRYLKILKDECCRETSLINDLLDLSRLDSGTEPLLPRTLSLQYWLPHIAEVFSERIQNHQQVLELDIPEHLPPLETDFNYLELVLTELLHNACKYTPAGEIIRITAAIAAAGAQADDLTLLLTVSNSGAEIPPSELGHVFDKFYRVPNNDPWKHGGTGLGLALVKKRLERLAGAIAVTSEHGWTTFTIQLPWRLRAEA